MVQYIAYRGCSRPPPIWPVQSMVPISQTRFHQVVQPRLSELMGPRLFFSFPAKVHL